MTAKLARKRKMSHLLYGALALKMEVLCKGTRGLVVKKHGILRICSMPAPRSSLTTLAHQIHPGQHEHAPANDDELPEEEDPEGYSAPFLSSDYILLSWWHIWFDTIWLRRGSCGEESLLVSWWGPKGFAAQFDGSNQVPITCLRDMV